MKEKTKPADETKPAEIIIDASGAVLGRVASFSAKQALLGKKVIILNCNNILLTGRRRMIIEEYSEARRRGGKSLNGPHFPKNPERVMKRTIRGMLSYTQQRGLSALKRVTCFNSAPAEYASSSKLSLARKTKARTISLNELNGEI